MASDDNPNFHGCVLWLLAASVAQRTSSCSSAPCSADSLSGLRNVRSAGPYPLSAAHAEFVIATPEDAAYKAAFPINSLLESMVDLQDRSIHSRGTVPPLGNQPSPEHETVPNDEKRPGDRLVVSGQPERQVDVEIVRAILCVAACQVSQRATAPVHRENRALHQYQSGQNCRPAKLTPSTGKGIATMHPAKKNQTAVWRSFIPMRTGIRSDWAFTMLPSLKLMESMGNNFEVPKKRRGRVDATGC